MATVGNLIAEVRSIESFLKSQSSLGQNVKLLRNQQATNLIKKIMALKDLTYEKAAESSNLFKGSQWEKADVDRVSEAIRKRLGQGAASSPTARVPQSCPTVEFYLTQPEWDKIEDTNTPPATAFIIMRRACARIGLLLPDEPTKGRMASIIRYRNLPDAGSGMSTADWYSFLQRFKAALEPNRKQDWHFEWQSEYPSDPRDLPADILQAVFPESVGPPALRDVPELGSSVILRKNHRSMRPESGTHTVSPGHFDQTLGNAMAHMYGPAMAQMFQQVHAMAAMAAPQSQTPQLQNLQIFGTPQKANKGLQMFAPARAASSATLPALPSPEPVAEPSAAKLGGDAANASTSAGAALKEPTN